MVRESCGSPLRFFFYAFASPLLSRRKTVGWAKTVKTVETVRR
jgi:hypothetical protein